MDFVGMDYAEVAANAALTLIAVACSLLDRQLAARAAAFERTGGFTERLYQSRSESRKKLSSSLKSTNTKYLLQLTRKTTRPKDSKRQL